jgi:hypothetical protein
MRWTRVGGMAAFMAALAIVLALCLGLWSHWTASAQDTFIVNDDTTPASDGCGTPDFETEDIEDAIDSGLVADGDTLVICEGTYNPPDAIEVTKSLRDAPPRTGTVLLCRESPAATASSSRWTA